MKRFRVLTAVLCAAVLLCGFSVPAYAYAGGEGEDYGDPTMETPAPEPTITPGEGFSEEGNLVTRDLLYDEHTNKQFITVQTSGGNTFYIVIDYDKPVDEEGEQYETYFFSVVDEGDLLAAAEAAGVEQAVCSCPEKCAAGTVNTDCPVCSVNMGKCVGAESEPEPAPEPEPEPEKKSNSGMLLLVLGIALIGGGLAGISRFTVRNTSRLTRPRRTMAWITRTMTSLKMTAPRGTRRTKPKKRRKSDEFYQQSL